MREKIRTGQIQTASIIFVLQSSGISWKSGIYCEIWPEKGMNFYSIVLGILQLLITGLIQVGFSAKYIPL